MSIEVRGPHPQLSVCQTFPDLNHAGNVLRASWAMTRYLVGSGEFSASELREDEIFSRSKFRRSRRSESAIDLKACEHRVTVRCIYSGLSAAFGVPHFPYIQFMPEVLRRCSRQ